MITTERNREQSAAYKFRRSTWQLDKVLPAVEDATVQDWSLSDSRHRLHEDESQSNAEPG
jgi:hypothetical protein